MKNRHEQGKIKQRSSNLKVGKGNGLPEKRGRMQERWQWQCEKLGDETRSVGAAKGYGI